MIMRRRFPRSWFAFVLASSSTAAFAQAAGGVAPTAADTQTNDYSVELDLTAGAANIDGGEGGLLEAVGIEVERRVTESLRVRAMVVVGGFASFDRFSGDYRAARVGIEAHTCAGMRLCFDGGVDAAIIHMTESETYNPDYMVDHTSPAVFLRAGIDIGGRTVRGHLAFDAGIDKRSDYVAALLLGVSLQL